LLRWSAIIAVAYIFIIGIIYIAIKGQGVQVSAKNYITWSTIVLFVISFVVGLVWYLINKNVDGTNFNPMGKEYVLPKRAREIVIEELIIHCHIPYVFGTDKRKDGTYPIYPTRASDIYTRNETTFPQGDDLFMQMQVHINNADVQECGVQMVTVQIDKGEDYIKGSVIGRRRHSTTFNRYDPLTRMYPLSDTKSLINQLLAKRLQLMQDGASEEDLREGIDSFIREAKGMQSQQFSYDKPVPQQRQAVPSGQQDDLAKTDDVEAKVQKYEEERGKQ
jgi:hypothetical protein